MGSPASPEPYRPGRPAESASGSESDFSIEHGFFSSPPPARSAARETLPDDVRSGGPQFAPTRDPELGNHYPFEQARELEAPDESESGPEPVGESEPEPEPVPVYQFLDQPDANQPARKPDRPRAIIYVPPVVERAVEKPRRPQIVERILRDRRLQIAVLVALIGALGSAWQAARNRGVTSMRSIRSHPNEFDGRQVKVRGRVGDVFPVGNSYAFNLLSGRDTLVVFTHTRVPVPRQRLLVSGSVSTGVLEGIPRPALFETPQ